MTVAQVAINNIYIYFIPRHEDLHIYITTGTNIILLVMLHAAHVSSTQATQIQQVENYRTRLQVHQRYNCTITILLYRAKEKKFPKLQEPPKNSGCQKAGMKQIPHYGLTNWRSHRTKFSRLGGLATEFVKWSIFNLVFNYILNTLMYVCMYVCMYACMNVCMYVRMYVCMYVCMYVWIYVYIYIYT